MSDTGAWDSIQVSRRDRAGALLADQKMQYVYTFCDGLFACMDIR